MSENKKDSFTFSDKIKNSKPAFNPFSKRVSSKIGSNGKPKKTLFERTRRDAPFFIAATAALLMLPFLYKYSGTVEEPNMLPPGTVGEDFVPERFDYDPAMGNGEIAQVSGLDPLSLIKGWGSEDPKAAYDDRDSMDDDWDPPSRPTRPTNKVNSPYRDNAPAVAKGAFKRTPAAPTKIGNLKDASMAHASAGGIGTRFGGASLKAAAKANSAPAPKSGTKPVSLTPLQSAGNPSRSYFGQGGAAQARASRDAMGKANATVAIQDALFTPVEHSKVGGLADGVFAAGGGAGQVNRNFSAKPLKPWWWDMRAQQEMEKWKWKYFFWRKPLADLAANLIGKIGFAIGCCVITGQDDCAVDKFFGAKGGVGDPAKCMGLDEKKWKEQYPNIPFGKDNCKAFARTHQWDESKYGAPWKDSTKADGNYSMLGIRGHCLGMSTAKFATEADRDPGVREQFNCEKLTSEHLFKIVPEGKAIKWKHKYYAVLVKNDEAKSICKAHTYKDKTAPTGYQDKKGKVNNNATHELTTQDAYDEYCVVYVGEAIQDGTFSYKQYTNALNALGLKDEVKKSIRPVAVEGFVMKDEMRITEKDVPIMYKDFVYKFVDHYPHHNGFKTVYPDRVNVQKKLCKWTEFNITAHPIALIGNITATLAFDKDKDKYGQKADGITVTVDVLNRTTELSPLVSNLSAQQGSCAKGKGSCEYYLDKGLIEQKIVPVLNREFEKLNPSGTDPAKIKPFETLFLWKAIHQTDGESQSRAEFDYGSVIDVVEEPIVTPQVVCHSGQTLDIALSQLNSNCKMTLKCTQQNGVWDWDYKAPTLSGCDNNSEIVVSGCDVYAFAPDMQSIAEDKNNVAQYNNKGELVKGKDLLFTEGSFQTDDLSRFNKMTVDERQGQTAAKDFVEQVATAFVDYKKGNDKDKCVILVGAEEKVIPVYRFIEALQMAQSLKITDVSRTAVCEFVRGIGKGAPDNTIDGKPSKILSNYFGAVAIYMGLDAAYYPFQSSIIDGEKLNPDPRFQKNPYDWSRYVLNYRPIKEDDFQFEPGIDKTAFDDIMTPNGQNNIFPLKTLLGDNREIIPIQRGEMKKGVDKYRQQYREEVYNKIFAGHGQCDTLTGNMQISDVIDYVESVVTNGLTYKPKNGNLDWDAQYCKKYPSKCKDKTQFPGANNRTEGAKI